VPHKTLKAELTLHGDLRSESFYEAIDSDSGNKFVQASLEAGLKGCRILNERLPSDCITSQPLQAPGCKAMAMLLLLVCYYITGSRSYC
jgi:hypothetical protein